MGVEIHTCPFQTGCQLSSAASGISLGLCFSHNFSGMNQSCWTTGSWWCCLSLEVVSSIPTGSTIIYRFLCGFICVSLCQRIRIKPTKMCVCIYVLKIIYVYVAGLYHSITCSEYSCLQEEQPRLSEHMVRFTRFFRADSRLAVLVLSIVKVPYSCAASWGVTAESRFNRWPTGLVFTFDGHRALVFWQGGSDQYFRLREQHVTVDQEKQTYRPRKAPHRGWTFNEVTNSCWIKSTQHLVCAECFYGILNPTRKKKMDMVSAKALSEAQKYRNVKQNFIFMTTFHVKCHQYHFLYIKQYGHYGYTYTLIGDIHQLICNQIYQYNFIWTIAV